MPLDTKKNKKRKIKKKGKGCGSSRPQIEKDVVLTLEDLNLQQEQVNNEFDELQKAADKIAQSSARKKSIKELAKSAETITPQEKAKMVKQIEELTAYMENLKAMKQPVQEAENRLRKLQRNRTSAKGKRGKRRKRKKTLKK